VKILLSVHLINTTQTPQQMIARTVLISVNTARVVLQMDAFHVKVVDMY
jgi:hypothetical protein